MASSGSFTTSSRSATGYPRNATFSWSQKSQSVENNTTTIDWTFTLGGSSSSTSSIKIYTGSVTVNGNTYSFDYSGEGYKKNGFVLKSGSTTITHTADGTKSFSASGGVNIYGSNEYYSGSGNFTLNTIPRASTPTLDNATFNIGDTITINTNRASSSFTHTVKIKYGTTTTTIATGVGASVTYDTSAIADALYALIPNAKSYTGGTIEVTTYNGTTEIGTKSCAYTANAVASAASPLFSNYTYADTNSTTTAITGNSAVLISGKSTLAVTISAANKATAQKSATMTKYTYQIAGLTGEENYSTSQIVKSMGSPAVAPTELPSGTRDLVVTAVDSRGYSTAVTKQVTIVPYEPPTISASAARLNGFETETTIRIAGAFSRIEVSGTAKNTVNTSSGVKYRYKPQSSTTWGSWTNKTATVNTGTGTVSVADFQINLDNGQAYDIEVQITDKLQTTTAALVVSAGQPAFWIGADGRVSVGGMPTQSLASGEKGLLEVNGRMFATGNAYANGNRLLEAPLILDLVYPVGSIFMSTTHSTASAVAEALGGGTWEAWGSGRVPVGMGSNGTTDYTTVEHTGGAESRTLAETNLPRISGTAYGVATYEGGRNGHFTASKESNVNIGSGSTRQWTSLTYAFGQSSPDAIDIRQPYVTVYMWKRTA